MYIVLTQVICSLLTVENSPPQYQTHAVISLKWSYFILCDHRSFWNIFMWNGKSNVLGGASKKADIFPSSVYPTPPPLRSVFCELFFWCVFYLRLWFYVFWNGFYARKSQFSCNYWNPQFLLLLLLPSGWSFARGRPLILTTTTRACKNHFHPTSSIPNSSLLFAAALSKNGPIAI